MKQNFTTYLAGAAILLVSGCKDQSSLFSGYDLASKQTTPITEEDYLDAGILEFETNIDESKVSAGEVFPEVRKTEARYFPLRLRDQMLATGAWKNVWVVPDSATVDLLVKGKIITSNGEVLRLKITAEDASGSVWLKKTYKGEATKIDYAPTKTKKPFSKVFAQIAKDLLKARNKKTAAQLENIRNVAKLRFAADFSPEMTSDYIEKKGKRYELTALPADNDPIYQRVLQIKERDDFFLDAIQGYYQQFAVNIGTAYHDWGKNSQIELTLRSEAKKSALWKGIAAALALAAGAALAANRKNSPGTTNLGTGLAAVGAYGVFAAVQDYNKTGIYKEALTELGLSLESHLQPQVIEIENKTVSLEGTVGTQYRQFHTELKKIYFEDRGAEPEI